MNSTSKDYYYAIVRNIPKSFRSKNLRQYFSSFIENDYFNCFHYRHRPEIKETSMYGMEGPSNAVEEESCCCVIRFDSLELRARFIDDYHFKPWTDEKENLMDSRCFISPIKLLESSEKAAQGSLSVSHISSMLEFRTPFALPRGNVGTSTAHLLQMINECKLPSSAIKSLAFMHKRQRKYGSVNYKYEPNDNHSFEKTNFLNFTERWNESYSLLDERKNNRCENEREKSRYAEFTDSKSDSGDSEDWERHEALNDDIAEQEHTIQNKYEEELEVTWEKGGPGLVWHLDTFTWKQIEEGTDSDWKWTDSWDVDYSLYDDENVSRNELGCSAFKEKKNAKNDIKGRKRATIVKSYFDSLDKEIGYFEKHTKGLGSRLMKRFGWKPGDGLGVDSKRQPNSSWVDIMDSCIKYMAHYGSGLGYHGEKLQRLGLRRQTSHSIRTIYDESLNGEQTIRSILPAKY